ncbi:preprotein translocase subunit SecE [Paraferrimonas sp. SM1919]|uniref:preprotein translocase subunit SecE n=1 Tax=Paraferrimonas sp. SM1919 TaxID=2662263 RepID=UPI0013D1E447|nr:preprotein translocase subunit SecE [Paraferrimonas sp. SM1919]
MTTNTEEQRSSLDFIKWGLIILILAGAAIGNQVYADISVLYRAIAIVVAFAVSAGIALQTAKGKAAVTFAQESKMEVRKVVWPTTQETRTTTLIVLAATGILAFVLWVLDFVLVEIVSFITGV